MKIFLLLLIVGVASSIHITCRFNFDLNWAVIGQVYTCEVTSMDFTNNSTNLTGYSGQHLAGNSSIDVKMIWFPAVSSGCPSFNLRIVPRGFSNFFPNFIALHFGGCSINSLNGDELQDYPDLQYWNFWGTNLTRVPGNFFDSNPNMKFIQFSSNKIEVVGFGLLDDLQKLERAHFASNICINKSASNPSQIPALIAALRQNCTRCQIHNVEDFACGLSEQIEENQEKIENLEGNNENLQARTEILEASNQNLENEVNALKASNEALEGKVGELNDEIDTLKENNEKLQTRTESLEADNAILQTQVGSLVESNESLKAENEEIRANLQELERIVNGILSSPCLC